MDEPSRTIDTVRTTLQELKAKLGTWEAVGKHYGINKTTAWKIVNKDYEPQDPRIRAALGLPEIVIVRQRRDKQGRFAKRS